MQNYFPEYEIAFSFYVLNFKAFLSSAIITARNSQINIYQELYFDLNRHAKCNFDSGLLWQVFRQIQFSCYTLHTGRNCFNLFQISFSANITNTDPGISGVSKDQRNCEKSKTTHCHFFLEFDIFLIFNLKILPIWFFQVSKCYLKAFFTRISKQGLLFDICMWFFNFQNLVRSCQHIGGTPCTY